jgi:TPR repeat protein
MELSTGNAVGPDAWEIPVRDLGYAWIFTPEGFVGPADLVAELRLSDNKIADRQVIEVEWDAAPELPPPQRLAAGPAMLQEPAQHQAEQAEFAPATSQEQTRLSEPKELGSSISTASASRETDRDVLAQATSHETTRYSEPESPISTGSPRQQADRELSQGATRHSEPKEVEPLSAASAPRQADPEEVAVLLKRGKDLLGSGDLAAARLLLQRAADANDVEATLALAATYDPYVLRELKVYSFAGDPDMARAWYEKAKRLGSTAASRRLEILSSAAR